MTPPDDRDEFFIGYAPPLPARLSTFITRVVTVGAAGVALAAAAVAAGHIGLEGGIFEFGRVRASTGRSSRSPIRHWSRTPSPPAAWCCPTLAATRGGRQARC